MLDREGDGPFWIYGAEDIFTAIVEGRFRNKIATAPGHFRFSAAAKNAVIAQLDFSEPLRLFDLSGEAVSVLGIYDELRGPDYEWCQWLGWEIGKIIREHQGAVHGFVYPSRRNPGKVAYAISSCVKDVLETRLTVRTQRLVDTDEYARLVANPCCTDSDSL